MPSHGKERYKIYGNAPEIDKLPNSRRRIIVRCDVGSLTEDWYYSNEDKLFRDFGDLYTAPIETGDSWQAKVGEAYPNMALIAQGWKYIGGNKAEPVVEFVYETLTSTWTNEDDDSITSTANGLRVLTRKQVALPDTALPYDEDDVGVATIASEGKTLYLAGFEDTGGARRGSVTLRWAEAGILNSDLQFKNDLLFVTFESQGTEFEPTLLDASNYELTDDPLNAFQGGDPAILFRKRIRNVNGFRRYIVTAMMKKDGSELGDGDTVSSFVSWDEYNYPGVVDTDFDEGIVPQPGGPRAIKVQVEERLTQTASVGNVAPFSIKSGCYVNVRYTLEETGLPESLNKAFGTNYLAGALGISGSNTTFLGEPVSSIDGGGGSDPTYEQFLGNDSIDDDAAGDPVFIDSPILGEKIVDEFVTDEGDTWYRIRKTSLIGKFGDY